MNPRHDLNAPELISRPWFFHDFHDFQISRSPFRCSRCRTDFSYLGHSSCRGEGVRSTLLQVKRNENHICMIFLKTTQDHPGAPKNSLGHPWWLLDITWMLLNWSQDHEFLMISWFSVTRQYMLGLIYESSGMGPYIPSEISWSFVTRKYSNTCLV